MHDIFHGVDDFDFPEETFVPEDEDEVVGFPEPFDEEAVVTPEEPE